MAGDEPRHLLRVLRGVAGADEGVAGHVGVLPDGGIPEELRQPGDPLDPRHDTQRLAGLLGRRFGDVADPVQAVLAGGPGERSDLGMLLDQPVAEHPHRELQLVDRRGGVGEPAGRQPLLRHGQHPRRQLHRRLLRVHGAVVLSTLDKTQNSLGIAAKH